MATTIEKPDLDSLTARQREIYDYILGKIQARGYGPTVREIGNQFGIKSPNGVMAHLKTLQKDGLIQRESSVSRTIEFLEEPSDSFSIPPQARDLIKELADETHQDAGRVAYLSAELYRLALEATKRGERVAFVDSNGHIVQQVTDLLPENDDDVRTS